MLHQSIDFVVPDARKGIIIYMLKITDYICSVFTRSNKYWIVIKTNWKVNNKVTALNHSINTLFSSKHWMKDVREIYVPRSAYTQSFSNNLRICDFKCSLILMNDMENGRKIAFLGRLWRSTHINLVCGSFMFL